MNSRAKLVTIVLVIASTMTLTATAPASSPCRYYDRVDNFTRLHDEARTHDRHSTVLDRIAKFRPDLLSSNLHTFSERARALLGRHEGLRDGISESKELHVGLRYRNNYQTGQLDHFEDVEVHVLIQLTSDEERHIAGLNLNHRFCPKFLRFSLTCAQFETIFATDDEVTMPITPTDTSTVSARTLDDGRRVVRFDHRAQNHYLFGGVRLDLGHSTITVDNGRVTKLDVYRRRPNPTDDPPVMAVEASAANLRRSR